MFLACNAGSSSLKAELFAPNAGWRSRDRIVVEGVGRERSAVRLAGREPESVGAVADHRAAANIVLECLGRTGIELSEIAATGHRVVHGGDEFSAPVAVDDAVLDRLATLEQIAPLHNPPALSVMREVRERLAGRPLAAVFDTAFFRDLPAPAQVYAIPEEWRRRFGIRRYGFHGIAHEHLHRRYRALRARRPKPEHVVSLQLGQGCSVAALLDGCPVETSMGFTPLEGLIMGTRPGDLDAGVLLALARGGTSWNALDHALNRASGLLALSGISDDVRDLLARESAGDARARLALSAFCHRARKYVGAYAAVLGGLDAILFGGGIGENSPAIRRRICSGVAWLGLELDERANEEAVGVERAIAAHASAIEVFAIPVREEEAIARAAYACLAGAS
jgi:acetate kinase